ncbi:MAG TPA: class I SAM-dependent methyltransferase [Terriglobales bacterium]|nr:class I SAM-dependent methyltransferase [Terriglobales bacterium]
MPTDYAKLSENLSRFYNFTNKVVLFIGAGGRQLLDPATRTKKLIAIDRDVEALRELKAKIMAQGLQNSVEVIGASFEEITVRGDTIYFEFCLHEMDNPEKALLHAKLLAPDIVVYDHSPGSKWIYYGAEEDKVVRSAAVMHRFGIRRRQTFEAEQRFMNFAELLAKVSPQGPLAIERIQQFAGAANIVIPMTYELNLL